MTSHVIIVKSLDSPHSNGTTSILVTPPKGGPLDNLESFLSLYFIQFAPLDWVELWMVINNGIWNLV